jgi:RNA polymerase sigma-70 factor (ECF subfamily)
MWTVTDTIEGSMESEAGRVACGLRSRDPEFLDGLIERFHYRLFRYLFFLTGSRETAEDLFQETWMRILEKGHLYNGRSKFEAWLFAIARNLYIDLLRRSTPVSLDELLEAENEKPNFRALDAPPQAERILRQEEESRHLESALCRLPPAHREVLVLRFQEDMALDEIAAVVAAPLSTVKSRLYRGLEMMKSIMEKEGHE